MSEIKVLAGDFLISNGTFSFGTIVLKTSKHSFVGEKISSKELEIIQIASEESIELIGGCMELGETEANLFGSDGILAKHEVSEKEIIFVAKFKDGRKFLGITDPSTFKKMGGVIPEGMGESLFKCKGSDLTSLILTNSGVTIKRLGESGKFMPYSQITSVDINNTKDKSWKFFEITEGEGKIKCPKCDSEQISSDQKGFGVGKALGGAVLFGGVGLLGGLIGSKKVMLACLKCGNRWEAGTQTNSLKFISPKEQQNFEMARKIIQERINTNQNVKNQNVESQQSYSDVEEIVKFSELRDKGIITEEEFQTKKSQILMRS